jgi:hypothetical protein
VRSRPPPRVVIKLVLIAAVWWATKEQYDAVVDRMDLGGRMAPGGLIHVAGSYEGGLVRNRRLYLQGDPRPVHGMDAADHREGATAGRAEDGGATGATIAGSATAKA